MNIFHCEMTGELCKFITRWSSYYELGHFENYASFWILQKSLQHRKQKLQKNKEEKGQGEEEKESNTGKEPCNPWALARAKEMELILFMWGR